MDLRKFQSAKADCERVLLMDSTNRAALNNLGLACNDLGNTATTFRCLKAMVRLDLKDDVAWLNTASSFLGTLGRRGRRWSAVVKRKSLVARMRDSSTTAGSHAWVLAI